jgi:serine/threonine-protein kinase
MQEYIGKQIDRYHVIERQGMGGMAVVYHAYDTRLERDVALKLIRTENIPQSQQEQLLKRFEREAKAQARFSHPHIVPIHDYGEVDGIPYLVMDYVRGGTLKQLTGQPMAYRQALRLVLPIADALRYAHARGVIHRDVKPGNILMNEEQQPLLTDFGIAKLLETTEATLTGTGVGVGTPEYMAPEQWHGKSLPQTDIYALGVVLYELVTGVKPYQADTPAAVAILQATESLPRPASFVAGLPESLENLIYKALARDPQDRYESMQAMQQALQILIEERPSMMDTADYEEDGTLVVDRNVIKESQVAQASDRVQPASGATVLPPSRQAPPIDVLQEQVQRSKRLPAWLLWGAASLIVIGVLTGVLLLTGRDKEPPLVAALPTETAFQAQESENTPTLTVTPSLQPTTRPTATITQTPTIVQTPTLGIGATRIREADGMPMVYVPAGKFTMGSSIEQLTWIIEQDWCPNCQLSWFEGETPVRQVYLDAYWIDQFEVTNAQYALCVAEGNCSAPALFSSRTRGLYYGNDEYANYPAVRITWQQAVDYCAWAGGQLPTEAQWEKAARGIDGRIFPWGDDPPSCELSNFGFPDACVGETTEVGSYPRGASPYGAMDMAGNVNEWVSDWYFREYYAEAPDENPSGPLSGEGLGHFRVIRGGSFRGNANSTRTSARSVGLDSASNAVFDNGFRCVFIEAEP